LAASRFNADIRMHMLKGKGKVVPVLFFITDHHAMKAYWGVEL